MCINPLDLREYNGSIGLPMPSTDVCIKDEDGSVLPMGEIGELCVKGPQVMKGYWQRPEETAKVIDAEGWLHTGDMAKMDETRLLLHRRPQEGHDPGVRLQRVSERSRRRDRDDARRAGSGRHRRAGRTQSGETVKVFIVKKDPALTAEQVKAFCRENLTGYKRPKLVEFRNELPKTNVGKILRKELREPVKAG